MNLQAKFFSDARYQRNEFFLFFNFTRELTFWLNPNGYDVWEACQVWGGAPGAPPIYLRRLWSDFQNSFVWWKLVKIVIDFYSIGDFLSFTAWLLEVAEMTKVRRIKISKQKMKFHNFWATSMLYTSKECIFQVEFKFKQKV